MKADMKKLDHYRAKAGQFRILEVPATAYLMVDGSGDPTTSAEFREGVEALYPMAYTVKFMSKARGEDFVVGPLEALWWADDYSVFTDRPDRSAWQWTLMIAQPDWVTEQDAEEARDRVGAKKDAPPALDRVRWEILDEGLCVQTLHIGPYDEEGPILERMHGEFLSSEGLALRGRHHEIYLSDPDRTAPEKLRTLLRQPVSREHQPPPAAQ